MSDKHYISFGNSPFGFQTITIMKRNKWWFDTLISWRYYESESDFEFMKKTVERMNKDD